MARNGSQLLFTFHLLEIFEYIELVSVFPTYSKVWRDFIFTDALHLILNVLEWTPDSWVEKSTDPTSAALRSYERAENLEILLAGIVRMKRVAINYKNEIQLSCKLSNLRHWLPSTVEAMLAWAIAWISSSSRKRQKFELAFAGLGAAGPRESSGIWSGLCFLLIWKTS